MLFQCSTSLIASGWKLQLVGLMDMGPLPHLLHYKVGSLVRSRVVRIYAYRSEIPQALGEWLSLGLWSQESQTHTQKKCLFLCTPLAQCRQLATKWLVGLREEQCHAGGSVVVSSCWQVGRSHREAARSALESRSPRCWVHACPPSLLLWHVTPVPVLSVLAWLLMVANTNWLSNFVCVIALCLSTENAGLYMIQRPSPSVSTPQAIACLYSTPSYL